jgi:ubiquinone/menaquinone biosynthesis C-methylase UbiE
MDERDYTALAADYDRTRFDSPLASFLLEREVAVIRHVIESHAASRHLLLDVACGTGQFTHRVADLFDRVVGVDVTRAMLKRARERGSAPGRPGPWLVEATLRALPIRGASCDVVLSTRFLHLFPRTDHRRLLERLLHPLRAGGLLVVEHDSPLGQWRQWLGSRSTAQRPATSYHPDETPPTARRVAVLGAAGPYVGRLARRWPTTAHRLAACFARPPLNRLSPVLIAVYEKT